MTAIAFHPAVQELIPRLAWTLIHSLWQGVAAALLLLIVLRATRRASARARYIVCCAALLTTLLACAATFQLLRPSAVTIPTVVDIPSETAPLIATTAPPSLASSRQPPRDHTRILQWIVLLWITGVLAFTIHHTIGWMMLQRLRHGPRTTRFDAILEALKRRLRIPRLVTLIETTRIDVPAVIGVFKPIILVPLGVLNDLTPRQIESILAHELAHIRRHDYLINLLQTAGETLLFYHPAVWWMSSRIRAERENCCDDIAADVCGDAYDYASALAELEARRGPRMALAATGSDLLARVRRLLKLPAAPPRHRARSLAAAIIVLSCIALPLLVAAQREPATTAKSPEQEQTSPIQTQDLQPRVEDYKVGPGDLVNISITDLMGPGVETVKAARVSETGLISVPLVGALKVAGLSTIEIEKEIARAYRQANLIPNAQVSAHLMQSARMRFSVLGAVDRPGVYEINKTDLRMLEALATAGGRPQNMAELRVVRSDGAKKRVLEIPLNQLIAGDPDVNVIIRPGDVLISTPAEKKLRFLRVVVAKDKLLLDGTPIDLPALKKKLEAIPLPQRRETVLEISAASPDLTVERFFGVSGQLSQLVKEYELAYLSQTGIGPATQPATQAARHFIGSGEVHQSGAYTLPSKKITLEQAVAEAGGNDAQPATRPAAPATRSAAPETDPQVIAQLQLYAIDPIFRELVKSLDQMEYDLARVRRTSGENSIRVRQAKQDVELQKRRVAEYVERYLQASTQPMHSSAAPETDPQVIAQLHAIDPSFRQVVQTLDQMEFDLARLRRNSGENSIRVREAEQDIELQKQVIAKWVQRHLQASQPMQSSITPATQPRAQNAEDDVRRLWRDALDAEMNQDWSAAFDAYQRIKALPSDLHPWGLDARLEQARKRTSDPQAAPATVPTSHPPASLPLPLLQQRAAIQKSIEQASQSLGDAHPTMVRLRRRLDEVSRKLDDQLRALADADPRTVEAQLLRLAQIDPTMRRYLRERDALQLHLAEVRRSMGSQNRVVLEAEKDLEHLERKLLDQLSEYLKSAAATTRP